MMRSSDLLDSRTTARLARWSLSSGVIASSSSMPSTPFIGVRISWLTVARKVLLARLAASAASFAARRSPSRRFSSVMSAQWPLQRTVPSHCRRGAAEVRIQRRPPRGSITR